MVFRLEVYYKYKVDRLLTCLTAQQKGTAALWYTNKTSISKKKYVGFITQFYTFMQTIE